MAKPDPGSQANGMELVVAFKVGSGRYQRGDGQSAVRRRPIVTGQSIRPLIARANKYHHQSRRGNGVTSLLMRAPVAFLARSMNFTGARGHRATKKSGVEMEFYQLCQSYEEIM